MRSISSWSMERLLDTRIGRLQRSMSSLAILRLAGVSSERVGEKRGPDWAKGNGGGSLARVAGGKGEEMEE